MASKQSFLLELLIRAKDQASAILNKQKVGISSWAKDNEASFRMVGNAGKTLAAGVAVSTAAMGVAVASAIKFEDQMANVNTMLTAQTEKLLPELAAGVERMAVSYGEGTETLTKGLYDILSAGIDASKSINVLETATKMAVGGMTDTGTAADALTTVLNSYSLSADNASDVSDLLFKIVKGGKTTMGELGLGIGQVAALAASSGLSIEDMGAALSTMTQSGLKTDIAITSLKGILTTFLKPQKEAVDVARELGFELNSNTLQSKGFGFVLEKLKHATTEQTAAVFGNVRALTGVSSILKDTTVYHKEYASMINRTGSAEEAFQKKNATTAMAFKKTQQEVIDLQRQIGKELLPIFKDLLQGFSNIINRIRDLDPELRANIVRWGVIATAVAAVIAPILILIGSIPAIVAGFTTLAGIVTAVATATGAMMVSMGGALTIFVATAVAVALLVDKWVTYKDAVNASIKANDDYLMIQGKATEQVKRGYDIFKEYKDLEISDIADKQRAYDELTTGIKGLYTALSQSSGDAKIRIAEEIKILEDKRTEVGKHLGQQDEVIEKTGEQSTATELLATATKSLAKAGSDAELAMQGVDTKTQATIVSLTELNDVTIKTFAENFKDSLDKAGEQAGKFKDLVTSIGNALAAFLSDSFVAAFESIGKGWDDFSEGVKTAMSSFKDSVVKAIADIMAYMVAKKILDFFLGWGSPPTSSSSSTSISSYAKGGYPRGLSLVGEQGAELVDFGSGGGTRIYSNSDTQKMIGEDILKQGTDDIASILDARDKESSSVNWADIGKLWSQNLISALWGKTYDAEKSLPEGLEFFNPDKPAKEFWAKVPEFLSKVVWGNLKAIIGGGTADKYKDKVKDYVGDAWESVKKRIPHPHFASGGYGRGLSLVGEAGAEFIDLPTGSRVYNNADTMRMMGGSGGGIYVDIHDNKISDDMDLQHIADTVGRRVMEAVARERNF